MNNEINLRTLCTGVYDERAKTRKRSHVFSFLYLPEVSLFWHNRKAWNITVDHVLRRYKYRKEEKSSRFCVVFLVLSVLVQGEERNLGEDYFIQFVSFFGTREKDEDTSENHFPFCFQPSWNKEPSDYFLSKTVVIIHRADRFGNE